MIQRIRIMLSLLLISLSSIAQEIPSSYDFTENKGQWDERVLFHGTLKDGAFFLAKDGFYLVKYNLEDVRRVQHLMHSHTNESSGGPIFVPDGGEAFKPPVGNPGIPPPGVDSFDYRAHAIKVTFKNASNNIQYAGEKEIGGGSNYFLGNDPSKWASGVKTYTAVTYKNVYPNIDIRFISTSGGLKYDIIVRPGGNPKNVILEYEGAEKLQIIKNNLVISTSVGPITENIPESYVYSDQKAKENVTSKFELLSPTSVGFKVNTPGAGQTLVIDPTLVFSSYTGSAANQFGYTATPGADGSLFSGGIALQSGFPVSLGAFQSAYGGGGRDIAIFRFSSNGSQRMYATYIGGSNNEYPHSLIADAQGNLVVLGRTNSTNFPGTRLGPGGQYDIIVSKLNPTGTAMIGSLIIGGSSDDGVNLQDKFESGGDIFRTTYRFYGDDSRGEVILKQNGNILVASQTQSDNFHIVGNSFQRTKSGGQDGVIFELNADCTNMIWSSFLGGSEDDAAFVLTEHENGKIYVAGATASSNFPNVQAGSFVGSPADAFISIISSNGQTLEKSRLVSTGQFDGIYGIQTDRFGDVYVMGVAEGGLDTINVVYHNEGSKQFVGKLDPNLNDWIFRTIWGTNAPRANISPVAFMVDRCQNMYIAGWGKMDIPGQSPIYSMAGTQGLPFTADAFKAQTDNQDLYFMVLARNSTELLYATFYGQDGGYAEHVDGGTSRFDQQGIIYMAVCANCEADKSPDVRFPTTAGAWSRVNGSRGCNLAAVKMAFNYTGVASGVSSYNAETNRFDTIGCVPFRTILKDTMLLAETYEWQIFNRTGGLVYTTTTTHYELPYEFTYADTFTVRLIAIDPATCNERDTSEIRIYVSENRADLDFEFERGTDCQKFEYTFTNLSQPSPGNVFSPNVFRWDFGDGHTRIASVDEVITHVYAREGNYRVTMTLLDPFYCNADEPVELDLRVTETLVAQILSLPGGCFPYTAQFTNLSQGGITFNWHFGDGNATSTDVNPSHTYNLPGTYTVRLIAEDEYTCNKIDTTYFTLTVSSDPTSAFSYSPTTVTPNTPFIFTNQSTDAVQYKWNFGDNTELTVRNLSPITHDYLYSGTYNVQLIAINQVGCTDTSFRTIIAEVHPSFDVPNAFTPGRGGENSIVKVKGFGIVSMRWVIYNRWGQKVFESTDKNVGWDGTFNGKPQPMDVYAYTLEVQMTTGESYKKTGDITLIR